VGKSVKTFSVAALFAAVSVAVVIGLGPGKASEQTFVTIGTGGVTGVYYPTGGAICRLVNLGRKDHGVRCSVESTGGSVYNIETIRAGELDLGVAQSDLQNHAYRGTGPFADAGAFSDLRTLFSVHAEAFTVVARSDAGITRFEDLRGKRVNIGNPGSGQRAAMEVVMAAMGWTVDDFALASELKPAEQSQALCDNRVDAIIYTVGHPSASIKEATTSCDGVLIPVKHPNIDALIESEKFYRKAVIPGGLYRGNEADVATFDVLATVVASTALPPEIAYIIVKSVFDNLDEFRELHPAFAGLEKAHMATDGLSAPLHEGARRYFEEAGLDVTARTGGVSPAPSETR
jgi:uncharacterized protein